MLFKMEIIEEDIEEQLTYSNPYQGVDVLIASSPEGTNSYNTAFVVSPQETITFTAKAGLRIYGRTKVRK